MQTNSKRLEEKGNFLKMCIHVKNAFYFMAMNLAILPLTNFKHELKNDHDLLKSFNLVQTEFLLRN